MPTYSEPTFRVALTRNCPSCGARPQESCHFGPHANLKDPMFATCVSRALPRDIQAELKVINELTVATINQLKYLDAEKDRRYKYLMTLAEMHSKLMLEAENPST